MADKYPVDVTTVAGYQIRVRLLHIYPIIWRRLLLRSDNTFADLHAAIQIAFNWTDSYQHHFKLHGKLISTSSGWATRTDSAEIARLGDFDFRQNQRFQYEYNFFDYWQLEVRIESCCQLPANKQYPRCIGGKRAAPPESCGGVSGFKQLRGHYSLFYMETRMYELAKLLLESDRLDDELRYDLELRHREMGEFAYWLQLARFHRQEVNRRLRQYSAGDDDWHIPEEISW